MSAIDETDKNTPRRFRWLTPGGKHPNGTNTQWSYGVYFPATDLVVNDMGWRATGKPIYPKIEWLDKEL
jgi:hypothetical protein